jgi:fumarate hydratase subunit beta
MTKKIEAPLTKEKVKELKAGDMVLISGTVYTARDAAHKRMVEMLQKDIKLPFNPRDQIIYFTGPSPTKPGQIIGSAGPTTSGRMDKYSPQLIKAGLTGMIGKGERDQGVVAAMKKYGAVYFGATGGAAALISKCIIESEIIAFDDLGTEAIRRIKVKDFPCVVIIDTEGNNLYSTSKEKYRAQLSD